MATSPDPSTWPFLRFEEEVTARSPGLESDMKRAVTAQQMLMPHVISQEVFNRAARLILSLAISDFESLTRDCRSGTGRGAMRSARALIEHAINLACVLTSEEDAARYLDHLALGDILVADSAFSLALLDKARSGPAKHALNKARRRARPLWDNALAKHGGGFRRSWAKQNLADRAKTHDLGYLYEGYRIASLVTHGSAGGSFGHFHTTADDVASYSMGRSPILVPLALVMGCEATMDCLARLSISDPTLDTDFPIGEIKRLLRRNYRTIWDVADQFDRTMRASFEAGKANGSCIMAFSRGGRIRWYAQPAFSPDLWFRARENDYTAELTDSLSELIKFYSEAYGEFNEGGWAAITLPGMALNIDPAHKPIPSSAVVPCLEPTDDWSWWRILLEVSPDGHHVYEDWIIGPGDGSGDEDGLDPASLLGDRTIMPSEGGADVP